MGWAHSHELRKTQGPCSGCPRVTPQKARTIWIRGLELQTFQCTDTAAPQSTSPMRPVNTSGKKRTLFSFQECPRHYSLSSTFH